MSKRFTETNKWRDPWYLELSLQAKAVFGYITDNCDSSGVWDPNKRLVNFSLKCDIDWDSVVAEFGNRIAILPSGKWWITRFCQFQYGQLNPNCPPHRSVIEQARKNGLVVDDNGSVTLALPFAKGSGRDKEEEKDKEKDTERGVGGGNQQDLFRSSDATDTPPPPPPPPAARAAYSKTELQHRVDRLFRRREATVWDAPEKKAWERAKGTVSTISEEDWQLLEWFYALPANADPQTYRRRDLATLLNNFGAELDRARAYRAANPKFTSARHDIYTEPAKWRERAAAKWPTAQLPERWEDLSATLRNDLLNVR
jgi:hypothetical protein